MEWNRNWNMAKRWAPRGFYSCTKGTREAAATRERTPSSDEQVGWIVR